MALRSAQTGTDHLYYAIEDVWLGEISVNGGHRITQYFFDAAGRETNRVVYAGITPGEAVLASSSNGRERSCTTVRYPNGGSAYAIYEDERGKETHRSESILEEGILTREIVYTNGVEALRTEAKRIFGGGYSVRHEWDGKWREECRFPEYAPDGKRLEKVVTHSSDYGTVTNLVLTYDFLGRVISEAAPIGITQYEYIGSSSRISRHAIVSGDTERSAAYLYDEAGFLIGTVQDGITEKSAVAYEIDSSNAVWKVTSHVSFGESTNKCDIIREKLTGLSNSCRSLIEQYDISGKRIRREKIFDPIAKALSAATLVSGGEKTTEESKYGLLLKSSHNSKTTHFAYDALGRRIAEAELDGSGNEGPERRFEYAPGGDLAAVCTATNQSSHAVERYGYDMLGNRTMISDALGNLISRVCDPFGNILIEHGASYPVRMNYDTQNRLVLLAANRGGNLRDETHWQYHPETGLPVSKRYADQSMVYCSYTPGGLPERTSYPSGRQIEVSCNQRGDARSVRAKDECVFYDYDEFGRVIVESNSVSRVRHLYGNGSIATNELWETGGIVRMMPRRVDGHGRISFANGMHIGYDGLGRISSLSNGLALVEYQYDGSGLDLGYRIVLTNGTVYAKSLIRDRLRPELVLGISTMVNGNLTESIQYGYDALGRPIARNGDAFAYNHRGEIASARISGREYSYLYDEIGNLVSSSSGSMAKSYNANSLNQYTSVYGGDDETSLVYDIDGNLACDGACNYSYDSFGRLESVSSNGIVLAVNSYDGRFRRVRKTTQEATTFFFYDGWNLTEEHIGFVNGATATIRYYWGKDLSGERHGAGGTGGLLYLTVDGALYIPCYDNNGNVTKYLDEHGGVAASYAYDAFGNLTAKDGILSEMFRHRFSTKYWDGETGLYYYGYRFYNPGLMRWTCRDPIGETGGLNLYAFCGNNPVAFFDDLGNSKKSIAGGISGIFCEIAYNTARMFLKTPEELRAWDRYTNHCTQKGDIEIAPESVKMIAESLYNVNKHIRSRREACKNNVFSRKTESFGGTAPSPWNLAIGGVSVKVTTLCNNGCFSYSYEINDLYDFDVKGIPGISGRPSLVAEAATILTNFAQTRLRCNWNSFFHKGIYYGK